ncbi:MAG: glycoside hydrolase [Flavipsychrobacter sp.]|nr:glycoside hydrolase [Flavipsychrobacter sp.]
MPMKNHLLLFTSACILLAATLVSCHTAKPVPVHKPAPVPVRTSPPKPVSGRYRQPKFMSDVYMDHHNKTGATVNAIQPRRQPQKTDPIARMENSDAQQFIVSTEPKATYRVKETRVPVKEIESNEENYLTGKRNPLCRKYAEILETKPKEINNLTLYSFIDKWYGTDYRLGGCDISGIDCSGFAQRLYADVYGIDLLRTSVEQFKNCTRIKHTKDAEEGDLIFFKVRGRRISHVGIYLMNDYFVHASTSNGVMISNLNEEYWAKSYAGIGRLPKN